MNTQGKTVTHNKKWRMAMIVLRILCAVALFWGTCMLIEILGGRELSSAWSILWPAWILVVGGIAAAFKAFNSIDKRNHLQFSQEEPEPQSVGFRGEG